MYHAIFYFNFDDENSSEDDVAFESNCIPSTSSKRLSLDRNCKNDTKLPVGQRTNEDLNENMDITDVSSDDSCDEDNDSFAYEDDSVPTDTL